MKNTRRKKLYIRRGGDETTKVPRQTPESIPMQTIEQTQPAFLGQPDDVKTETAFVDPPQILPPLTEPVEDVLDTNLPITPDASLSGEDTGFPPPPPVVSESPPVVSESPPLTEPVEDVLDTNLPITPDASLSGEDTGFPPPPPVVSEAPPVMEAALPEQPEGALIEPIEEQNVRETEHGIDLSDIPPPPKPAEDEPATDTKDTEQKTSKVKTTPKDKKYVLVRVSMPDGNIMDVQGENETTLEDTVRELKSDDSKPGINNEHVGKLETRVNELENIIKELNAKLTTLEKQNETLSQSLSVPTLDDDIFSPPPPVLSTTEIEPSDEGDGFPPSINDPEQPDDDLTAFSELDD